MIHLTQVIFVHAGKEAVFQEFEDIALPLMAEYGGKLLYRLRPTKESTIFAHDEQPYEVHILSFESEEALLRFSKDERRASFLHLKEESVRASLLMQGELV